MPLAGRGRFYDGPRAFSEWLLGHLYRGAWPARLCRRAGLQPRVRVVHERVAIARWPEGAPPLRVAFASDLHAGPTTHPSLLAEAVARIRYAEPDLVLLGGDYVFLDARHFAPLRALLATIDAPIGRLAVMGNHDLWADDRALRRDLEGAGFRVLCNDVAHLPPPFEHVSVCGLDDPWTGERDPTRAFRDARDVRILLMHAPSGLLLTTRERFDLALCGHTHGGHIALPGGVPIVSAGPLSRRHPHGRHELEGGGTLIVSRGVGGIELPIRAFAAPDVVVVDLGRDGDARGGATVGEVR